MWIVVRGSWNDGGCAGIEIRAERGVFAQKGGKSGGYARKPRFGGRWAVVVGTNTRAESGSILGGCNIVHKAVKVSALVPACRRMGEFPARGEALARSTVLAACGVFRLQVTGPRLAGRTATIRHPKNVSPASIYDLTVTKSGGTKASKIWGRAARISYGTQSWLDVPLAGTAPPLWAPLNDLPVGVTRATVRRSAGTV
jgi:hypothetical protein